MRIKECSLGERRIIHIDRNNEKEVNFITNKHIKEKFDFKHYEIKSDVDLYFQTSLSLSDLYLKISVETDEYVYIDADDLDFRQIEFICFNSNIPSFKNRSIMRDLKHCQSDDTFTIVDIKDNEITTLNEFLYNAVKEISGLNLDVRLDIEVVTYITLVKDDEGDLEVKPKTSINFTVKDLSTPNPLSYTEMNMEKVLFNGWKPDTKPENK